MGKVIIGIGDIAGLVHDDIRGKFELIKVSGGTYHMFSNDLGMDLILTSSQLAQAIAVYQSPKEWTQVEWHANSAIKLPCYQKGRIVVHGAFKCLDTETNEWITGDGFDYMVKGSHSGCCPSSISTIEEAMEWIDKNPSKV